MIIYLVKSILLLGLLYGVYKLLLENEKMHHFKRFFLLFALLLGLTAPLISFEIYLDQSIAGINMQQMERVVKAEAMSTTVESVINSGSAVSTETEKAPITPEEPGWSISIADILIGLYGLITLFLLIRFVSGLFKIRNKIKAGTHKETDYATLVLLEELITPQSFLDYIFLEKQQFELGKIEPEILDHEFTHVRQFHSFDVLLIEFLKVIFWFNPLMYLFKHAIQLNHEFLADESVVSNGSSVNDYQKMLIRVCSGNKPMNTASSINYSLTKKRIKMMGSKLSIWRTFPKVLFSVSIFSILAFISCTETKEWPDTMTWEEVYDRIPPKTYFDVDLESEGVTGLYHPLDERTGILISPEGESYTGERNTYSVDTGSVIYKETIVNGKVLRTEFPRYDSTGVYQYSAVTIPSLDEDGNKVTTYYSDQLTDSLVLSLEIIKGSGIQTHNFYYPSGQLKTSASYSLDTTDRELLKYGLMTEYDKEGNITMQKRYEDGELIETIE